MDSIETIVVQADLSGNLSQAAQAAVQDLARLEAAASKAQRSTADIGEGAQRASAGFSALEARLDSNVRLTNAKAAADARLAREIETITRATESDAAAQGRANLLIEAATRNRDAYIARVQQDIAATEKRTSSLLGETQALSRTIAAQEAFNRVLGVIPNDSDNAKRAADISAHGAALDATRAKFSPLFAAQNQYRTALQEIAAAEKAGVFFGREAADARMRATQEFSAQVQGLRSLKDAHDAANTSTGRLGNAIGQAGFQLQDFAVQVSSGQSALVALGQQGSQMLGVFGAGGAIAGAVLAVGVLAAQFILGKDAAAQLSDALKDQETLLSTTADRAQKMEEALRRQGDQYRSAEQAGARFRAGLQGEGETVVRLAEYYGRLTVAQRAAEGVALERQRQQLVQGGGALMGDITTRISGRLAAADGGLSVGESGMANTISTAIGNLPPQVARAVEAVQRFRDAGQITVEAFSNLVTAVGAARQAGGENSAEIGRYEQALIQLLPRVREYEEAMRRLGVTQQAQAGRSPEVVALEAMRGVTSEVGGTYQTRQRIADQRRRIQEGLASGLASPEERAAARSSLQVLGQQSEGLTPATQQQLRGLREQAALSRTAAGAARELAQVDLDLDRAARGSGAGMASAAEKTEARRLVQERMTNDFVQFITVQNQATLGVEAQAEAMRGGARAADDARIQFEAEAKALTYARAGTEEYRLTVEILTGQLTQQRSAQEALNSARTVANQEQQLALIQRETELVGAGVVVRERELAVLRERQRIVGAGGADPAANDPRLLNAAAISNATQELTRQQAAYSEIQRVGEQAFDRIGSAITSAFANGTMQTLKFGNIAKAVLSEVAQAALRLAVINPIKNFALGANAPTLSLGNLGSLGGVFGGPQQAVASTAGSVQAGVNQAGQSGALLSAGRYGNLGQAFTGQGLANTGFGLVDGALNTQLVAPSTLTQTGFVGAGGVPIVDGSAGLTVAGGIGGAAGIAGGAYGIYQGIQKGGVGGAVGVAGGTAGVVGGGLSIMSGLGMIGPGLAALGPYALIAAAVLAVVSAMLPGEKASGRAQSTYVNVDDGSVGYAGLGGKRFSQENREQSQGAAEQIANLAREVGKQLGGAQFGSHVAVGVGSSRGEGAGKLYLDVAGRKGEFSNDEAGSKAMAETAARYVIQQFRDEGRASGDYAKILNNSGDDIKTLSENLDWYEKIYQTMDDTTPKVAAFDQAMTALRDSFQPNIDKAVSLGLAHERLFEAREKELAKMEASRWERAGLFDDSLLQREKRLSGDNLGADLMTFDAQAKEQLASVKTALEDLGLTGEEFSKRYARNERVLADERLAIQKQYGDQSAALASQSPQATQEGAGGALGVITNLRGYAASLATGEASSGTATDRLTAAQRQFDAVFGAARAGDANSISGLQGAAEAFRSNARDVFGGGQGYADALRLITDRISNIGGFGADALTQSFVAENARTNTDRVVDQLAALRADINMLLLRPAA